MRYRSAELTARQCTPTVQNNSTARQLDCCKCRIGNSVCSQWLTVAAFGEISPCEVAQNSPTHSTSKVFAALQLAVGQIELHMHVWLKSGDVSQFKHSRLRGSHPRKYLPHPVVRTHARDVLRQRLHGHVAFPRSFWHSDLVHGASVVCVTSDSGIDKSSIENNLLRS